MRRLPASRFFKRPQIKSGADVIVSSGIFDLGFYVQQVRTGFSEIEAAIEHFLATPPAASADPHPLFSNRWYRRQAGLDPQANALLHFIEHGHTLQHDPHPLFVSRWYWEQNKQSMPPDANPLSHYLRHGSKAQCRVHPLFDDAWYRATYPDVDEPGFNTFAHYVASGSLEGRNPSAFFDTAWYKAKYRPLEHALVHYMTEGAARGFDPSQQFATQWYARKNPDVARMGLNPLVHFVEFGRAAGRPPIPDVSLDAQFAIAERPFLEWRDDILLQRAGSAAVDDAPRRLIVKLSPRGYEPGDEPGNQQEDGRERHSSADLIRTSCDRLGISVTFVSDIDGSLPDDVSGETFLLFLQEGDMLDAAGLESLWAALRPPTRLCIFDMFFTSGDRAFPILLPGFNPLHLRTIDCTFSRFAICSTELRRLPEAAGTGDRARLLSALARIVEERDFDSLVHVPAPVVQVPDLTDEIRRAREAAASRSPVDLSGLGGARVSIVICTKDKGLLVNQLLLSLFSHSKALIADVVIVSNQTTNVFAKQTLADWATHPDVKILTYDKPFNFSDQSNLGAAAGSGEFVLFLNDDIVPAAADWLSHLLAPFLDPTVGITGPRLVYPNETLQHGGMHFGDGTAFHTLRGASLPDDDYLFATTYARDVSMVTGAALILRRSLFEDLNGFDTQLASIYQDVDLCLRVAGLGYRVLYIPSAILLHMESVSLTPMIDKVGHGARRREIDYFRRRHGPDALASDRFLNPQFRSNDETLRNLRSR